MTRKSRLFLMSFSTLQVQYFRGGAPVRSGILCLPTLHLSCKGVLQKFTSGKGTRGRNKSLQMYLKDGFHLLSFAPSMFPTGDAPGLGAFNLWGIEHFCPPAECSRDELGLRRRPWRSHAGRAMGFTTRTAFSFGHNVRIPRLICWISPSLIASYHPHCHYLNVNVNSAYLVPVEIDNYLSKYLLTDHNETGLVWGAGVWC